MFCHLHTEYIQHIWTGKVLDAFVMVPAVWLGMYKCRPNTYVDVQESFLGTASVLGCISSSIYYPLIMYALVLSSSMKNQ